MIYRKSTFFLGIFIFIVPFLGLPLSWKMMLVSLSGLALVILSTQITIPKKHHKPKARRERSTPVFVENAPVYPSNDTVEKAGPVADVASGGV